MTSMPLLHRLAQIAHLPSPQKGLYADRPWYHPIELAKRLVIYALIAYAIICVYLAAMQTRMIYVGSNDAISTEAAIDANESSRRTMTAAARATRGTASRPQNTVPSTSAPSTS